MPQKSAGIILYRKKKEGVQVFLVHPGGPFWAKKDEGAWSIPKGEFEEGEDPQSAAVRELKEETGLVVSGRSIALGPVKQKSGKVVYAWAFEGEADPAAIRSNEFEMEWPPKSGKMKTFPEVDRAGWFGWKEARAKILPSQLPLLAELESKLE